MKQNMFLGITLDDGHDKMTKITVIGFYTQIFIFVLFGLLVVLEVWGLIKDEFVFKLQVTLGVVYVLNVIISFMFVLVSPREK